MTARHKLNSANLNGLLIIAGIVAYYTQSWIVFIVLLGILIASSIHSGGIRPSSRKERD